MRRFGLAFNQYFEKWMFLIIPCSLLAGFFMASELQYFIGAVPYLFAFVTFTMAVGCGMKQLKASAGRPGLIILVFILAHMISPIVAYAAGILTFGADSPYVIGLVLFAIIPLGVSSVLWVGMSGGNIPLMLAMVVLDSLLSPFVVPAGIHLFFNSAIEVEAGPIMLDLTIIIVLPTIIGVSLYEWSKGKIADRVKPAAAPLSKLCFVLVVALNAAAIAPYIGQLKQDMLTLVPLTIALVAFCYAIGYFAAAKLKDKGKQITVSYATGMRNISLGIVLALGYFSPLAAVPVVLSILIQQPMATLHHYILQKLNNNKASETTSLHVG
ncbi:bile acid:sodium symporter family protein [Paenibacillus sp. GXUN7292]|uniref:bile acid:sodium symporter family protein n=1 Tax=Paenibacillus sp. GXUN7292 TaxID=3422499 RepID=UPI003D7C970A